jgi:hypothetical protein
MSLTASARFSWASIMGSLPFRDDDQDVAFAIHCYFLASFESGILKVFLWNRDRMAASTRFPNSVFTN